MNNIASPCDIIMRQLHTLKNLNNSRITIIAGHYCIADDLSDLSNEGETEQFSFELGVSTYKELKVSGNMPTLVLWINDIGINVEQRKLLKESYVIPKNYERILKEHSIEKSEVSILFESTARNKASVLFRKSYKRTPKKYKIFSSNEESLVRCIDNSHCEVEEDKKVYAISGPDGLPIVMKEGNNPKCNLILGTLFYSIIKTYKSDIILNIFNDIYIDRLRLGMFVGKNVYDFNTRFINFFCDEEKIYYDM